jgi:hypothetical protein
MDFIVCKMTVFFEEPFWIGLIERKTGKHCEYCKMIFGAEPHDYEVQNYLLKNWRLLKFSPSVEVKVSVNEHMNPKRVQREAQKEVLPTGIGTKAQQALKLQLEQGKQARKKKTHEMRELESEKLFELRQKKRLEKHRGH